MRDRRRQDRLRAQIRGLHPSNACARDMSGRRRVGSSIGSGSNRMSASGATRARTSSARALMQSSCGLPRLTGPSGLCGRSISARRPPHHVVDMAERTGLLARAVDGERPTRQRLHDQVGHDPPVIGLHPWSVGVENPCHPHIDAAGAQEVEAQRLGGAFAFVVAGARTDAVHRAQISLVLRMHFRIAIDFAGRRLQETRTVRLRQDAADWRCRRHWSASCVPGRPGSAAARPHRRDCRSRGAVRPTGTGCRCRPGHTKSRDVPRAVPGSFPSRSADLSMHSTRSPARSSASHRCEPMNPAPPATRTVPIPTSAWTSSMS